MPPPYPHTAPGHRPITAEDIITEYVNTNQIQVFESRIYPFRGSIIWGMGNEQEQPSVTLR